MKNYIVVFISAVALVFSMLAFFDSRRSSKVRVALINYGEMLKSSVEIQKIDNEMDEAEKKIREQLDKIKVRHEKATQEEKPKIDEEYNAMMSKIYALLEVRNNKASKLDAKFRKIIQDYAKKKNYDMVIFRETQVIPARIAADITDDIIKIVNKRE